METDQDIRHLDEQTECNHDWFESLNPSNNGYGKICTKCGAFVPGPRPKDLKY